MTGWACRNYDRGSFLFFRKEPASLGASITMNTKTIVKQPACATTLFEGLSSDGGIIWFLTRVSSNQISTQKCNQQYSPFKLSCIFFSACSMVIWKKQRSQPKEFITGKQFATRKTAQAGNLFVTWRLVDPHNSGSYNSGAKEHHKEARES